jgi:hypothetical protein
VTKLTLLAAAGALLIAASALAPAPAQAAHVFAALESSRAAAKLQYAGALTFSLDGVLFVGDNVSGAVFAYPMGAGTAPAPAAPFDVEGIDGRIALLLKTPKSSVHINGMAVHPTSHDDHDVGSPDAPHESLAVRFTIERHVAHRESAKPTYRSFP